MILKESWYVEASAKNVIAGYPKATKEIATFLNSSVQQRIFETGRGYQEVSDYIKRVVDDASQLFYGLKESNTLPSELEEGAFAGMQDFWNKSIALDRPMNVYWREDNPQRKSRLLRKEIIPAVAAFLTSHAKWVREWEPKLREALRRVREEWFLQHPNVKSNLERYIKELRGFLDDSFLYKNYSDIVDEDWGMRLIFLGDLDGSFSRYTEKTFSRIAYFLDGMKDALATLNAEKLIPREDHSATYEKWYTEASYLYKEYRETLEDYAAYMRRRKSHPRLEVRYDP